MKLPLVYEVVSIPRSNDNVSDPDSEDVARPVTPDSQGCRASTTDGTEPLHASIRAVECMTTPVHLGRVG